MRIFNFILLFVICFSLTTAEPSFNDFIDNLPRQISSAWNKLIDVIKTPIRLRRLGRRGRRKTTTTPTTQNKIQSSSTALEYNVFSPEHYIYRPKTTTKPRQGINVPFIKYQSTPWQNFGEYRFKKNETKNVTAKGQPNGTAENYSLSTSKTPKPTVDIWPGPMKLVTGSSTKYKPEYIPDNLEHKQSSKLQNKVQIPIILQPTTKKDPKRNLKTSTKHDWIYFILNGSTKEIIHKVDDDNTIVPLSTNAMSSLFYNITQPSSTKKYTKKIIHKKKITTKKPYIREIILVSNSDFDVSK